MRLGVGTQPVSQYVMYVKANIGENGNAWLGIDNENTTGSTALRLILNGATTSGFQYVQSTNMTQIFANAGDIQLINGSSLGLTIANTTGAATTSYPTAFNIDGTTSGVTMEYSGGTVPAAGNASSVDVYTYTIIKTASATYTVLGAGPIKYA
jgi:hypothetical protein